MMGARPVCGICGRTIRRTPARAGLWVHAEPPAGYPPHAVEPSYIDDRPEWMRRAADKRLPAKVYA